jgi:hypothetical protein
MRIETTAIKNDIAAIIHSEKIIVNETQDALDLMAECSILGASAIIMEARHFHPDFFILKTRLAGDILQKFSNYRVKLAITGTFREIESKSLNDFIFESNKQGHVIFVNSVSEAIEKLSK